MPQKAPRAARTRLIRTQPGFSRSRMRTIASLRVPVAASRAEFDRADGTTLPIRKDKRRGRYVIVNGDERMIASLDQPLTPDLTLTSTPVRCGRPNDGPFAERGSSYFSDVLRRRTDEPTPTSTTTADASAARPPTQPSNAEWRAKHRPAKPKLKPKLKHGAGCRKRGCLCEVGKRAERERQRRSRANRRRRASELQLASLSRTLARKQSAGISQPLCSANFILHILRRVSMKLRLNRVKDHTDQHKCVVVRGKFLMRDFD